MKTQTYLKTISNLLVKKHKLQQTIAFISEKTQITTSNRIRFKSCHTHLSSLLQPICYCAVYYAQIIEAYCVTYMIMVIDTKISNNADQQILSNLFKCVKRSLSQSVTSRSQNTFTSQNSVCGHCKFVQKTFILTIHTHWRYSTI